MQQNAAKCLVLDMSRTHIKNVWKNQRHHDKMLAMITTLANIDVLRTFACGGNRNWGGIPFVENKKIKFQLCESFY